jgi:hypothetical protein
VLEHGDLADGHAWYRRMRPDGSSWCARPPTCTAMAITTFFRSLRRFSRRMSPAPSSASFFFMSPILDAASRTALREFGRAENEAEEVGGSQKGGKGGREDCRLAAAGKSA